ncbi:MAG: outer membrane beta-barrel protein [Bacteroidota bacterium]
MKKLLSLILLTACCALPLKAQEEDVLRPRGGTPGSTAAQPESMRSAKNKMVISYGVEAGLNYNMFSQDVERSAPAANSPEDVLKEGSGISPFSSVFIDIPLTSTIGVQIKGIFDSKSWSNTQTGGLDVFDPNGQFIENAKVEATYKTSALFYGLAALLRYNFTPDLFATVGPTFHFLNGNVEREDNVKIIEQQDPTSAIIINYALIPGQYSEISRTTTEPSMIAPPVEPTAQTGKYLSSRIGVEAGLGYIFPLSSTMQLIPQVRYNFAVTALAEESQSKEVWQPLTTGSPDITFKNSKVNSLQFSLALMFNL